MVQFGSCSHFTSKKPSSSSSSSSNLPMMSMYVQSGAGDTAPAGGKGKGKGKPSSSSGAGYTAPAAGKGKGKSREWVAPPAQFPGFQRQQKQRVWLPARHLSEESRQAAIEYNREHGGEQQHDNEGRKVVRIDTDKMPDLFFLVISSPTPLL